MQDGEFWAFRVFRLQSKLEKDDSVERIPNEAEEEADKMDVDEDEGEDKAAEEGEKAVDLPQVRTDLMAKLKVVKKEVPLLFLTCLLQSLIPCSFPS